MEFGSTLDHDFTDHVKQGAGDEKLFAMFHNHFTPDTEKSEQEGRPIFNDEVYLRIITPGNRDAVVDRPIRPTDKLRFPRQWAAFQAGEAELGSGTRLEEWSMMPRSMVEELRYFGFRTIEHVSEANDAVLGKMPGLRDWKAKATRFLAAAKDTAELTKRDAELAKRDGQIAALTAQVESLAKMVKVPEGAQSIEVANKQAEKNRATAAA